MLISFIVIARNEDRVIKNNLRALSNIANKLNGVEVILVDSNSSDSTLEYMKECAKNIRCPSKVILCSGELNAAVVRNIGFKNACGNLSFFIDGDTEVNIEFVEKAMELFENNKNLLGVTGQLSDYMYDDDFEALIEVLKDRNNISKQQSVTKFGGNVILRSDILMKLGGWDESFTVNEDIELAIRLATNGEVIAVPILIGNHHTKITEIYNRSYLELLRGRHSYYGQLLRKNISQLNSLVMSLSCNKGHVVGLCYYVLFFISAILAYNFGCAFFVPFLFLFFLDFISGLFKGKSLVDRFITRVIVPMIVIKGFLKPMKKIRTINSQVIFKNSYSSK